MRLRRFLVGRRPTAAMGLALITALAAASSTAVAAPPAMVEAAAMAEATPAEVIAPFSAHYTADWKSINVGTSDLVLAADAASGRWVYTWRITARGVFRIVYSSDVVQTSRFGIADGRVLPQNYRAEQGGSAENIDFDWSSGRARGTAGEKSVDLALDAGVQDVLSIQIQVMLDLKNGSLPPTFRILDKDEVKDFIYTQEGPARLRTALGEFDTVVVASRRAGGNRILRLWFAPSLGFVPVQAERTRDGKLEFAMRIKTLKR